MPGILAAAPAVELAVLDFDDYAGDVFEGIAAGYRYVTRLADGEGGIRTLERG